MHEVPKDMASGTGVSHGNRHEGSMDTVKGRVETHQATGPQAKG